MDINSLVPSGRSKIVDSWMFMSSVTPGFALFAVYFIVVFVVGPPFMKNRKPFSLNSVTRTYNVFQIIACALVIKKFYDYGFTLGNAWGCSNSITDENLMNMLKIWWFVNFVRVSELIETVFFVLRKKHNQISLLHVYHHIGTICGVWLTLKYDGRFPWIIHGVLNCAVHVIMYSYYLLSSFEKTKALTNSVKHFITIMQIVQLALMLGHSAFMLTAPCGSYFFLLPFVNSMVLLYLFISFYVRSYKKKMN